MVWYLILILNFGTQRVRILTPYHTLAACEHAAKFAKDQGFPEVDTGFCIEGKL